MGVPEIAAKLSSRVSDDRDAASTAAAYASACAPPGGSRHSSAAQYSDESAESSRGEYVASNNEYLPVELSHRQAPRPPPGSTMRPMATARERLELFRERRRLLDGQLRDADGSDSARPHRPTGARPGMLRSAESETYAQAAPAGVPLMQSVVSGARSRGGLESGGSKEYSYPGSPKAAPAQRALPATQSVHFATRTSIDRSHSRHSVLSYDDGLSDGGSREHSRRSGGDSARGGGFAHASAFGLGSRAAAYAQPQVGGGPACAGRFAAAQKFSGHEEDAWLALSPQKGQLAKADGGGTGARAAPPTPATPLPVSPLGMLASLFGAGAPASASPRAVPVSPVPAPLTPATPLPVSPLGMLASLFGAGASASTSPRASPVAPVPAAVAQRSSDEEVPRRSHRSSDEEVSHRSPRQLGEGRMALPSTAEPPRPVLGNRTSSFSSSTFNLFGESFGAILGLSQPASQGPSPELKPVGRTLVHAEMASPSPRTPTSRRLAKRLPESTSGPIQARQSPAPGGGGGRGLASSLCDSSQSGAASARATMGRGGIRVQSPLRPPGDDADSLAASPPGPSPPASARGSRRHSLAGSLSDSNGSFELSGSARARQPPTSRAVARALDLHAARCASGDARLRRVRRSPSLRGGSADGSDELEA